jgi:hypothetical protein
MRDVEDGEAIDLRALEEPAGAAAEEMNGPEEGGASGAAAN